MPEKAKSGRAGALNARMLIEFLGIECAARDFERLRRIRSPSSHTQDRDERDALAPYRDRITYLRRVAREDGYDLRQESKEDFRLFLKSGPRIRRGDLVLIDNGNLRVGWEDEQESQIGLQFLGEGWVQYVIFRKRDGAPQVSRVAGRDSLEGVFRQIGAFDLGTLVYE